MFQPRLITLMALCAALVGCAGSRPAAKTGGIDSRLTAEQNLDRLAQGETAPARAVAPAAVPLPPGVEPSALAPREAANPRAFQSLASVVEQFAHRSGDEVVVPQPVDEERRAEALKRYAKGRNAALDRRNLQAIIDYQKAMELDPNSAEVLRELARIYILENRTAQAIEAFEKLIVLEPDNADALFALGLAAGSRRDFELAATVLARLRLSGQTSRNDPVSKIVAGFSLATALRELNYDRAFIEAAAESIDIPDELMTRENAARLASVYRQRGETWRSIGDAHCRLGEHEQALGAYASAAALPLADPTSLHPRVIYADLCLGRPMNAQRELLSALKKSKPINERDVRLGAYLKENSGSVELLAQAVAEMHRADPDDGSIVRAAASLMEPEPARELLKEFVARQPRDLDGVTQLLAWLAQRDLWQAVNLTISLAAEHPDLADAYIDRLLIAVPRPAAVVAASRGLAASAARSQLEIKVLWKAGALGQAWDVCESARQQWPDDRALALQQLLLAAALQESALFEQSLAAAPPLNDGASLIALSQARRALNQFEPAIELAAAALELAPSNVEAMIEQARAHLALAASLANDPDSAVRFDDQITEAKRFAERAIEAAPQRDEAYEVLTLIYVPGGVRADTADYRATMQRLYEANPNSALHARLTGQEALAQNRYEQALDRFLTLYDTNPSDTTSLTLAVTAWQQWGKLDAADQWLNERVSQRPADPALLEQWVRVQLLLKRSDDVVKQLEAAAQADANDFLARRLLETVYRGTGQFDAARDLTEQRLLARPPGVRRELELAALYAGAELASQSIERLEWVLAHASDATMDELAGALRVIGRVQGDDPRRFSLHLELAQRTIERFPAAPLQIYGGGLLALARMNELDDRFDALADRAAMNAKGAAGETAQAAEHWRALAQALIDEGHPAAAARAVRARLLRGGPMEDAAAITLARTALLADATADAAQYDPQHAERSLALLRWMDEQGKLGRALDEAETVSLSNGIYEVSVYYTIIGSREGANHLLREAVQLDPDHAMALNNLGYAQLDAGRSDDETVRFIERAFAISPDEANILDTIGWLRYKQGRFANEANADDAALPLIEKSTRSGEEPSPEVIDHLGDVQWRLGQAQNAIDTWRKVIKLLDDPNYQQYIVQRWQMIQSQAWQLLVFDPKELYDREFGPLLERVKAKVAAAQKGDSPQVAPIFEEMSR